MAKNKTSVKGSQNSDNAPGRRVGCALLSSPPNLLGPTGHLGAAWNLPSRRGRGWERPSVSAVMVRGGPQVPCGTGL